MELKTGTLLQGGKYEIVGTCGQGGFGITYKGRQRHLGYVAIKEFFVKDFCNRDEDTQNVTVATQSRQELIEVLEQKFEKEARNLFRMRHINVVRVTDIFSEHGTTYYVMDYIDGPTLSQLIKASPDGRIAEKRAVGMFLQLCDALRYVHNRKMLHLDIKPSNIIVQGTENDERIILIDFGVAKQYDEVNGENTSTLSGQSPGYSPIEQLENRVQHFKPATDIYALGATYYKMVTGKNPPTTSDLLVRRGLLELPDYLSKMSRTLITDCMKLNVQDRPQSIDEVLAVMGRFMPVPSFHARDEEATRIVDTVPAILKEQEIPALNPTQPAGRLPRRLKKWVRPVCRLTGCIIVLAATFFIGKGIQKKSSAVTPGASDGIKKTAFEREKFDSLMVLADGDAPLEDDAECQHSALEKYEEALRLNPPSDLREDVERKIRIVEGNIGLLEGREPE